MFIRCCAAFSGKKRGEAVQGTDAKRLAGALAVIHDKAASFGLDGFPMRYELCPADVLYTLGAYGMPVRFSHWSFGKAFQRMKLQYDYNLSRIYELVINSDPCYAFLLESNTLLQNKVVAAHVLAHSDFFKHNYRFAGTSRSMVETMAVHAARMRRYEMRYGRDEVEALLDAALALQEQVDPHKRTDDEPRDLLLYLMEHSRRLEDWQRDVLGMVRDEMLYFWPQLETKILNEGWATFWHVRILRELDLTDQEAVEFARLHAAILAPSRTGVNPYHLGYHLLLDIFRRWESPTPEEKQRFGRPGGQGMEKLFEVRETETDVSLLRNYLTKELVEQLDLYVYRRRGDEWVVVDKDWRAVRDELVRQRINGGVPVITVADGDYRGSGELFLRHRHEGVDLDVRYTEKTLPYVYRLWGKPVHLETVLDGKTTVFSCDGDDVVRR